MELLLESIDSIKQRIPDQKYIEIMNNLTLVNNSIKIHHYEVEYVNNKIVHCCERCRENLDNCECSRNDDNFFVISKIKTYIKKKIFYSKREFTQEEIKNGKFYITHNSCLILDEDGQDIQREEMFKDIYYSPFKVIKIEKI